MYYYFSSSYPAVLKLNGIYYGTIHNAIKSCKVDGDEHVFVEICPLNGKEKPTAIILDKEFLSSPPNHLSITDLDGGYLLKFESSYFCNEFKVFSQQKYNDAVVTVFSENGYKLSIETKDDFYAESLEIEIASAEIQRVERLKNLVVIFMHGDKNVVCVYDINSSIKKVFSQNVDSAEFNENLITVQSYSDVAKHRLTTTWQYENRTFIAKEKKIERQNQIDREKLNPNVLPYAFLEELLVGGEYREYIADTLLENADKLGGFFGDFIGVMPPPIFRDIEDVGLIYNKEKNLYCVKYFRFELKENKIVNVSKC